ncbi:MAG: S41 family peptidase [Erysipelotrichaceae bacterium]|nr:S41 family peptidase [Erysipelotrichaceae bacterium]
MKKIIKMRKNEKIDKSKEIIKKEKQKIKEEKRKIRYEKNKKFYNTKFGKFIKKVFLKNDNKKEEVTLKEQIFSMIYFEIIGAILCLLVLFILSGGHNFIKLYKDLNKLINVYDTITSNYYGDLNKEELVDNAIESMLNGIGDSYTTYTDEETTNNFLENIEGSYEGIGCMVSTNELGEIYVVSIFDNSPAQKAGLQENDIILKIDGEDYTGKTSEDMANYVKGNENDKIKFIIKRGEEEKEFTVVREKVEVPTVTSKVIEEQDKKIGYIDISIFSAVTYDQFKTELEKLEKEKIQGLIIDVRNDTGGYLSAVTDISSLFLKKGQVIYQLEDNKKTEKIKDETKESRDYPIAVLINAGSASASEILASAIKESYNGFVVGTNSYGKGTVQKTKKLSDGSMIKYTVQKWLTPDGNWINEKGVEPTNFVELTTEENMDNQLQTALNLIVDKIK